MSPVSPVMPGSESIEVVLGKNQPQYVPLPVVYLDNELVPMISRWRLSDDERAAIASGADIVLTQLTFKRPYQPVHLQVTGPMEMPELLGEE